MSEHRLPSATDAPGGDRERWSQWLRSPPGRYALAWQQVQYDRTVADVFGYHAVQVGLSSLPTLRESRMSLRVFCAPSGEPSASGEGLPESVGPAVAGPEAVVPLPSPAPFDARVRIERPEELPFETGALDLVLLPHLLEFADDPHQVLREVDRVLRPEGRVIVSGFNPVSLWGARQALLRGLVPAFLPREGRFIGVPRLRDWFKLLSFEIDRGRFGCYAPPFRSERWIARSAFMEKAGDRWWPICGAVYFLAAVKRVRGMRLVGPAWKRSPVPAAAGPAVVAPPVRSRG